MILTMSQADAEMAKLFRDAWEVSAGYACDWPNAKNVEHADSDIWARWTLDYADGGQRTFGQTGARKFHRSGLIYCTIFTPLGGGLEQARDASEIAIKAYEGQRTSGDVWFRDVRIDSEGHGQGSGKNKSWWTTVVVAMFTYDQLR